MPSTRSQQKRRSQDQYNQDSRRIETEEEYELAVAKVEELWNAVDGTPDANIREVLIQFIEEYECRNEDLG